MGAQAASERRVASGTARSGRRRSSTAARRRGCAWGARCSPLTSHEQTTRSLQRSHASFRALRCVSMVPSRLLRPGARCPRSGNIISFSCRNSRNHPGNGVFSRNPAAAPPPLPQGILTIKDILET